jgi:alpha-1,3-fucosyltransferase
MQQVVPAIVNISGLSAPCQRKIIILYWTKYFTSVDFEYGLGRTPFATCDNNQIVCLTTMDRGLVNESDAVIFHSRDLRDSDLPPPGWRLPHQHFIFFNHESPAHTDLNLLRRPVFRNYFNRTMTYRRDSDIVSLHPYGRLKCVDPSPSSCLDFPRLNDPPADAEETSASLPFEIDLKMKNKTVAWMVSNCKTDSRRESLVSHLSLLIPVDVYGFCGNRSHQCPSRADCDKFLGQNYRFYLSFENSLCPDYITEKLYRPLAHGAVPVVYGGSDYSFYLPAGSYVNARDFDSPQSLAEHLEKLMSDDELYLSYFRWRNRYTVDPKPVDGMCQLCRLLSDKKTEEKMYSDIAEWWHGGNHTCLTPPPSLV